MSRMIELTQQKNGVRVLVNPAWLSSAKEVPDKAGCTVYVAQGCIWKIEVTQTLDEVAHAFREAAV